MFEKILGEAFPLIQQYAPVIATALGSPVAGTATVLGINLLSHAFGIKPNQVDTLEKTIMNDPEATNRLSNLEAIFSEWFKSHENQIRMPSKVEMNIKLEWNDTATERQL